MNWKTKKEENPSEWDAMQFKMVGFWMNFYVVLILFYIFQSLYVGVPFLFTNRKIGIKTI